MGSGSSLLQEQNPNISMAGFARLTEKEYDQLNFPNTPPPYQTAMDIAQKFKFEEEEEEEGNFMLDGGRAMRDSCTNCGKRSRGRCLSLDLSAEEEKVDGDDGDDDVDEGKKDETAKAKFFIYESQKYCSLDCFFEENRKKPCLCAYVDKLATMLFPHWALGHILEVTTNPKKNSVALRTRSNTSKEQEVKF